MKSDKYLFYPQSYQNGVHVYIVLLTKNICTFYAEIQTTVPSLIIVSMAMFDFDVYFMPSSRSVYDFSDSVTLFHKIVFK
jgi:hypothetical protein